ncbi:MAG TPA: hypothetical protein PLE30_03120 [Candidatus Kapabacteria bacterium]|nr:hypothetical protein [Candidatus Kapabacteria bacterium]
MKVHFKVRLYHLLIIVFVFLSIEGNTRPNNCFKYYLYFDFNKCTSCESVLLKKYISDVAKLHNNNDLILITKTHKKREFAAFLQNFNYTNIINDTTNQFTKFISSKTLPTLFVTNCEDRIVYSKSELKKSDINLSDILNNFKCINIDKYKSYKLIDSVNLYRPSPPILNQKQDNFITLDQFDQTIKEFNIKSGVAKRIIKVDSNLKYYCIKDSVSYYRSIIPKQFSIETKYMFVNYDKSDNIIVSAKAFNGLNSSLNPKIIEKKYLTLQYYDATNYEVIDLNDSISIYDLVNTNDGLLCLISHKYASSFNTLKSGNYYLVALLDSINDKAIDYKISYKDMFNYYNSKNFISSKGLFCELNKNQYAYLNPWNGLFFIFKDSIQDSVQIRGYLELIRSDNDSTLEHKYSIYDYKYKIMSLNSFKNKAIVYLCASNKENYITSSILQVYDVKIGMEKEIVLFSTASRLFRSYFLKIEDGLTYFLNQNESEEWQIMTIPINEVL